MAGVVAMTATTGKPEESELTYPTTKETDSIDLMQDDQAVCA